MKLLKWGFFFLFAFTVSFILLRTFSQDVFKETVPARILGYTTPAIPIYFYIAGSFIIGLVLGLIALVYNFVTSTADTIKKSRRVKELEKEVDFLSDQLSQVSPQVEKTPPISEKALEHSLAEAQNAQEYVYDKPGKPPEDLADESSDEEDEDNNKKMDNGEVEPYLG